MGLVVSEKKIFLVFIIVSLWDLSVAMETTILIQSAPKPNAINPPTQLWFKLNLINSVSPSPPKRHGKVAKKGHFLARDNMSKGHFQRAMARKMVLKWPMAC